MKAASICCVTLKIVVDMSTKKTMKDAHMPDSHSTPRKIIGFSMTPELAATVKLEAAKQGVSLRKLFEEMWETYNKSKKT